MAPKISLRISGTRSRQAGYAPLIVAGPPLSNKNVLNLLHLPHKGAGKEKITFGVRHDKDYSSFVLEYWDARPYDGAVLGNLTIAVMVPAGFKLSNGNPYLLLKELFKTFVDSYMVPNDQGGLTFENNSQDFDADMFAKIIQRYELKPTRGARVVMKDVGETGSISIGKDKMESFFNDSFYPQFADYKMIEVGESMETTPGLEIEVPRKVVYQIYFGDVKYRTVSNVSEKITLSRPDSAEHRFEKVSFTVEEVLNAPNGKLIKGKSKMILDDTDNSIMCQLGSEEIPYHIEFNTSFYNKESHHEFIKAINDKKIRVLLGSEDVSQYILHGNDLTVDKAKYMQCNSANIEFKDAETKKRFSILAQVSEEKQNRTKNIHTDIKFIPALPVPERKGNDELDKYFYNDEERHSTRNVQKNPGVKKNVFYSGLALSFLLGAAITFVLMWLLTPRYDNSRYIENQVAIEPVPYPYNPDADKELGQDSIQKPKTKPARLDTASVIEESPIVAEFRPATVEEATSAVEQTPQLTRAQAREEITKLVNEEKDIATCKNSEYWNFLSKNDKHAVELAVTGTDAAIQNKLNSLEGVSKISFDANINDAIGSKPYTWTQISQIPSKVNEVLSQFE